MYPFLRYFSELIYLNLFKCARLGYPLTCFMFSQFHIINCPKNNTSLLLFSELQSRSLRWNHWLVYIGVLWFFITVSSIHNIVIHDQKVNYLYRCEILCIYDQFKTERRKIKTTYSHFNAIFSDQQSYSSHPYPFVQPNYKYSYPKDQVNLSIRY